VREMSENRLEKAKFFYRVALNSYNLVISFNSTIDSKIHNALGLAIGLMPLLLGLFSYLMPRMLRSIFSPFVIVNLAFGLVMFTLAIVIGFWCYNPADFELIDSYGFINEHKHMTLPEIAEKTIATIGNMTRNNATTVKRKGFFYRMALMFLVLGGVGIALGFAFLLASVPY